MWSAEIRSIVVFLVVGFVGALFVFLAATNILLYSALRRFRKLARDVGNKDAGGTLIMCLEAIRGFDEKLAALEASQRELGNRLASALSHVGLVKFDAFPGVGGKQSFALALLDEGHSGVVLTSLCGREEVRFYSKPVINGNSPFPLSDEEIEAIRGALSTSSGGKEESRDTVSK